MGNEVIVYGTTWCGDTIRSRKYLEGHGVEYTWLDIDKDAEAAKLVEQMNHGNRSVPTIVFPDGSFLVEPNNLQLNQKLVENHILES